MVGVFVRVSDGGCVYATSFQLSRPTNPGFDEKKKFIFSVALSYEKYTLCSPF
jgi:hypothetical protein